MNDAACTTTCTSNGCGSKQFTDGVACDELYDLRADPYEMHNLIDKRSARATVSKMRRLLARGIRSRAGMPAFGHRPGRCVVVQMTDRNDLVKSRLQALAHRAAVIVAVVKGKQVHMGFVLFPQLHHENRRGVLAESELSELSNVTSPDAASSVVFAPKVTASP